MREDRTMTEYDAGHRARAHAIEHTFEPDLEGINEPLPSWFKSTTLVDFAAEVDAIRTARGF